MARSRNNKKAAKETEQKVVEQAVEETSEETKTEEVVEETVEEETPVDTETEEDTKVETSVITDVKDAFKLKTDEERLEALRANKDNFVSVFKLTINRLDQFIAISKNKVNSLEEVNKAKLDINDIFNKLNLLENESDVRMVLSIIMTYFRVNENEAFSTVRLMDNVNTLLTGERYMTYANFITIFDEFASTKDRTKSAKKLNVDAAFKQTFFKDSIKEILIKYFK